MPPCEILTNVFNLIFSEWHLDDIPVFGDILNQIAMFLWFDVFGCQ